MDTLGDRRRHQLERLLSGLEKKVTSELIVACLAAQKVDASVESDRMKIDDAMAAAWAFDRATHYLERLRALNAERLSLSADIASRLSGEVCHYQSDSSMPTLDNETGQKAGEYEVVANLYCVCVMHLRSLLKSASELQNVETPIDDFDFLNELRPLRNHFEHWYNRLPGKSNERELVTKTKRGGSYNVRAGLTIDKNGRYVVYEYKKVNGKEEVFTHHVDLRNHSFERIEKIFSETESRLRTKALDEVAAYFVTHPGSPIPLAKSIKTDRLFRAGGIG